MSDPTMAEAGQMQPGGFPDVPYLYAHEERWVTWDRHYRVYFSGEAVVALYVAGQIHDERTAVLQLFPLDWLMKGMVRRCMRKRLERELQYEFRDPFGTESLKLDRRNFRIEKKDIRQLTFLPAPSRWTPLNIGTLRIELKNGGSRRLVVVDGQSPEMVRRLLQGFTAETPRPDDVPLHPPDMPVGLRAIKPEVPGYSRMLLSAATFCLVFGGLWGTFAVMDVLGLLDPPTVPQTFWSPVVPPMAFAVSLASLLAGAFLFLSGIGRSPFRRKIQPRE